jgi:hypothetical protein
MPYDAAQKAAPTIMSPMVWLADSQGIRDALHFRATRVVDNRDAVRLVKEQRYSMA